MKTIGNNNYFNSKKEVIEFLKKFNFKYNIPDLDNKNQRYCIELNNEKTEVVYCSIESGYNCIYNSHVFYDNNRVKDFVKA